MKFTLTEHAKKRLQERNITEEELSRVLEKPQQIVAQEDGTNAYQSLVVKNGKILMLRAFVNDRVDPVVVISVYVTTDGKYWSSKDDRV